MLLDDIINLDNKETQTVGDIHKQEILPHQRSQWGVVALKASGVVLK
jgi:hypothetical protein